MAAPTSEISTSLFPTLIIGMCVLAGFGTYLMMPNPKRETVWKRIGAGLTAMAGIGLVLGLLQGAVITTVLSAIYFWAFAAITLYGAIKVITHPLPVYSALYFVLTVFSTAGLFVLLWAEFLAAALVIIYAGAILITYTFVIMLASEASGEGQVSRLVGAKQVLAEFDGTSREPLLACIAGFSTMAVLLYAVCAKAPSLTPHGPILPDDAGAFVGNVQQLGVYMFTHQIVSLQVAGLILTLAMVGALMIARKQVILDHPQPDEPLSETLIGPNTPADDNPHSIAVEGQPGPRSRERELAEF